MVLREALIKFPEDEALNSKVSDLLTTKGDNPSQVEGEDVNISALEQQLNLIEDLLDQLEAASQHSVEPAQSSKTIANGEMSYL